jgi:hypothetical protein
MTNSKLELRQRHYNLHSLHNINLYSIYLEQIYTGCLKIRKFRIQSVVGKDPVELEKYLEKKFRSS